MYDTQSGQEIEDAEKDNMKEQPTLRKLCEVITMTVRDGAVPNEFWASARAWTITLKYQGRQWTLPWYGGPATDYPTNTNASITTVIDFLLSDATVEDYESYEEWNEEYDSSPALYSACLRTAKRLRTLLGDDYETFKYAERS